MHTPTYREKPLVVCCKDTNSMRDIYEMALLICGGKDNFEQAPIVAHYSEPISPLVYYDPAVYKMIYSVENNIPLINFPCVQSSGTAPSTLAGAVIQGAAESISGALLAQAIKPAAPFVFGAFVTVMDMKTTVFSYGATETFEDRLREHTEEAMAHKPAALPEDVVEELDRMQKKWK